MDQSVEPGPEEVRIHGERLTLRPLRSAEIDAEWHAMVTADPMTVAELPDETSFRARLRRSGRMHDGWLDLAIDLDGVSIGRIQTFVPPGRAIPRGTYEVGIGLRARPRPGLRARGAGPADRLAVRARGRRGRRGADRSRQRGHADRLRAGRLGVRRLAHRV